MRGRVFAALVAAALVVSGSVTSTVSAVEREDADHYEFYFNSWSVANSAVPVERLHADVLRPKGLAMDVPTPVIMTVSPYTNHSTSSEETGPSPRFYDFLDLSGALQKGYTYVIVDLPGDGGSAGCNDWGGVREQTAVAAAVEWAAGQPWSNGKVGLLGKSYDGWTGLMGIAQQPKGLAAVASLEPVYSGYRYIWMNGVRRNSTWPYGTGFTQTDIQPGRPSEPEYNLNSAPQVWCYPVNIAGQSGDDSETGPYWAERNLIPTAKGKTTPLFLTQGFLEVNTKQDGTFEYFNSLAGDEHRAWYGQFDHCRAWELQSACNGGDETRLAVGRAGFIDELMRFFDEHLKGISPAVEDPVIEVQDNLGRWRAEASWPPEDMQLYETELRPGSFVDNGSGNGETPTATRGIWTISAPIAHDIWLAGEPYLSVSVDAPPMSNLAANVYDIAPDGKVTMISRGVQLLRGTGTRNFDITMYGQDWRIEEGHRIGVLLSGADTGQFRYPVTTGQPVTVRYATIRLPFLTNERTEFLEGGSTPRLEQFLSRATSVLPADAISAAETTFSLPPPLVVPSTVIDTTLQLRTFRLGSRAYVEAILKEAQSGAAIPGQEISFFVNDRLVGTDTTDSAGRADLILRTSQYGKRDVLRAEFAGTEDYEASSAER